MFSFAQQLSSFAIKTIRGLTMAEPSNAQLQFQSPTPRDVLLVKKILLEKARLPLELVDTIIDCAEYWPCTTTIRQTTPDTEITIRAGGRNENQFLVSN
jgi:hypothetical protein